MKSFQVLLLATTIAVCGAAMAKPPESPSRRKVTAVEIEVTEWSPAMVWATLYDRKARRCGGTMDQLFREIPGCDHGFEWEQGVSGEPPDSSGADSMAMVDPGPPDGLHFTLRDSASTFGLVREDGCELRLTSDRDGLVRISLIAEGPGLLNGRDTASVVVDHVNPPRLWLSWGVESTRCVARIGRLPQPPPGRK